MTQADLAERLGVHKQTVVGYEAGATITTERLAQIARFLRCSPADLLNAARKEEQPPPMVAELSGPSDWSVRQEASLPRVLQIRLTEFELEALKAGASEREMRFLRTVLTAPSTEALVYANARPLSDAEAVSEYGELIGALRQWLAARIGRRTAPPAIVDEADAPERQAAKKRGKKAG